MSTAQTLKEQGQQLALLNAGNPWREHAMTLLKEFLRVEAGPTFRWEQFRAYALANGLPLPPSPNAWGSLPREACKMGLIVNTGLFDRAQSARTHGHPVMLWRAA